jgi:hypothetical protein
MTQRLQQHNQQQQQWQQEAAAVQRFIRQALLPLLMRTAGVMNARALANSTWGLAKLRYIPDARDLSQVGLNVDQTAAALWVHLPTSIPVSTLHSCA